MALNQKIKNLDELVLILQKLKNEGKKIIHCHGVFDLMHPGHVRHFHAAKALGDILVVTVTPDKYVNKGPDRPVFTEELRAETIAALECVNYVAINLWPKAAETIIKLKPDIYVKGSDYAEADKDETRGIFLEREAVESIGGRIHFTDEITFSSSSLINEYFEVYPEPAKNFLKNFRKQYNADEVIAKLKNLKNLKVLAIGETILDEYAFVAAMISKPAKGNHIAARFLSEETHAGGILACANHLANFCGEVDLITTIGNDGKEEFVRSHLKSNINLNLIINDEAPTIIKKRFVDNAFLNKLFELYTINDQPSSKLERKIKNCLNDAIFKIRHYDLVLVLDYGHGLFTPSLRQLICAMPQFLAVNAQTNAANMGFNLITKYPRANYFCLDDRELRMAFADNHGNIRDLIKNLADKLYGGGITVTRGHLGALTYDAKRQEFFEVPVLSQKIVDTTGAGDAFLALTAPCVAQGFPMDLVGFIGSAAGALAVGYLGNRSAVEEAPLYKFITALLK
ncbi:MAG: adenylyltransferase/cytidyltransferase family protein [Parcubacteria group bacterium]|nr:adenylyltransferase/cytidyltransferase family protein [Parcubacteria group bacterium]